MSEPIISVDRLGKRYRLSHQGERQRYVTLRDVIAHRLSAPFRALNGRVQKSEINGEASALRPEASGTEDFWALKDVSFEIKQGEVLGIIGRNGAGKSTLLKILSRITEPTEGSVRINARVASLLEVGTGFHPELTGRENIFLNGAVLGMHRAEIKKKFDEIVAFAEVEKFLDTPVKRYSSGMYVRLAFAVAAHLEPEVLIVDEVLAVGDAEFQKKCLGKMGEVAKGGRTILFVSHNMAAVARLCQRGILLDRGRVVAQGTAESIVNDYFHSDKGDESTFISDSTKEPPGNDSATLCSASVKGLDGSPGPTFGTGTGLKVEIVYRILKPARGLRVGFHLLGPDGTIAFNTTDTDLEEAGEAKCMRQTGVFSSCCFIPAGFLNRGRYSISVGSDTPNLMVNFYCESVISFFIVPAGVPATRGDARPGLVCPNLEWEIKSMPQTP
jgi:lipopolysaccharide transport system ATP-binding protein